MRPEDSHEGEAQGDADTGARGGAGAHQWEPSRSLTPEQVRGRHPVLVTGGTGTLGRRLVRRLLEEERLVRVLSRRPRPVGRAEPYEWLTGDLVKGHGIAEAVDGVSVIVHCATTRGGKDVQATRRLAEAAVARSAGTPPHLVYISSVGIERMPFFYYRAKLAAEQAVRESGLPWTVLRTTQFHDLIARMTTVQRAQPVTLVPAGVRFQPVDTGEVAVRLAELAGADPAGRVEDMGGPQIRTARDLAGATLRAYGRRRPVVPVRLPGKVFRGLREGRHLAPGQAVGRITFEEFLAAAGGPHGQRDH